MKISLFFKPYIIKVCSFFIIIPLIAGTPLSANASFFSDLTTKVFGSELSQTTDEVLSEEPAGIVRNSQTIPLLESSISPDLKSAEDSMDIILVQNDSFISSEGLYEIFADANVEKSPLSEQIIIYTVKEGDTLSEIADYFGISMNTIRWENNISGQTISIGQKLNILPMTGIKHTVKTGDTVGKIADKYEADIEDILIFNGLSKGDVLKKDDIIFVPNGIIKQVISKPVIINPTNSTNTAISNAKIISGYFLRPVFGRVTSPYGSRRGGFHPGVDFAGARGTPVMVSASGIITKVVNWCKEGNKSCGGRYGNYITVEHPNGMRTRYAHLSKVNVSVGQTVTQGDIIGTVGNTGRSTGPHLHFEIENANGSKMRPPF